MLHPYQTLRSEYENGLATCVLTRRDEADMIVRKHLLPNMPRYVGAVAGTNIQPAEIAALHWRESDGDFKTYLGNGERIDRVTRLVPRGRGPWHDPKAWEKGAADAIQYDRLDDNSAPRVASYVLWKGEAWNGFGPRGHGIHTGYLWAGTNLYVRGKYTETPGGSTWNPGMVDQQMGIVPLLILIGQLAPQFAIRGMPEFDNPNTVAPAPLPVPEGVGANIDTAALQRVLNNKFGAGLMVDGNYGRRTRAAVRQFQASHNVQPVDGFFGPVTAAALTRAMGGK